MPEELKEEMRLARARASAGQAILQASHASGKFFDQICTIFLIYVTLSLTFSFIINFWLGRTANIDDEALAGGVAGMWSFLSRFLSHSSTLHFVCMMPSPSSPSTSHPRFWWRKLGTG
jgi:hypothetical protein